MTRSGAWQSGHSIGDANGVIVAIDANVCDLLQRPARELIGMSYLAITHPEDRAANIGRLAALPAGDAPIIIRKRYLRPDGGAVPVAVSVSRFGGAERGGWLVGTVSWTPPRAHVPDGLWRAACRVEELSRLRGQLLGPELFPDYPMNLLLRVYIAEMEGRTVSAASLAQELDMTPTLATRWLAALTSHGLIDPVTDATAPRQLSDAGIARLEHLLRAAGQADAGLAGSDRA